MGGSWLAIAATPRAPAAKGVPNASKMWSRRGAARLSAARGNNREDDCAGTHSQGRAVSDSPAFMSTANNCSGLARLAGVGGTPQPHTRDPCPNPVPGAMERERPSLAVLRHRLRGSWPRVSQPWFPGAEQEQDGDVLARPSLVPAIQGWQRLVPAQPMGHLLGLLSFPPWDFVLLFFNSEFFIAF